MLVVNLPKTTAPLPVPPTAAPVASGSGANASIADAAEAPSSPGLRRSQRTRSRSISTAASSSLASSRSQSPVDSFSGKRSESVATSSSSSPFSSRFPKSNGTAAPAKYDVPTDVSIPPFARQTKNAERDLARVWEALAKARRVVVVCGAGISVSSPANIPDFRSSAGLFKTLKEKHPNAGLSSGKDLFDARLFNSESTSALFYSMIAELKQLADRAQPTAFHHLLRRLDMEGRLQRVYTQNIDNLEERAGLTFGLGETGDSTATVRNLGKRKRQNNLGTRGTEAAWARCQSDSALLRRPLEDPFIDDEHSADKPMFPRTIPLHGSLSTLTCTVCKYKLDVSVMATKTGRESSPGASERAIQAMEYMARGEPVPCMKCEDYERVREVAGLRSRGCGWMKVGVVLYGGQNEGAEQVGECLQRDILGLRDPKEPGVPETAKEREHRERRERKAEEKKAAEDAAAAAATEASAADTSVLSSVDGNDTLASLFEDGLKEDEEAFGSISASQPAPSTSAAAKPRKPKVARLKPLPPDLLIVAGTSLKVPGTKRIVREFAKACHARDRRVYPDSDEEDSTPSPRSKGKGRRDRSPSTTPSDESDEDEDEDDIDAPIRTLLLNYDFPLPAREWEGVFDAWVQGDVQRTALGLWEASTYPAQEGTPSMAPGSASEELASLSWAGCMEVLAQERKDAKKGKGKASPEASQPNASQRLRGPGGVEILVDVPTIEEAAAKAAEAERKESAQTAGAKAKGKVGRPKKAAAGDGEVEVAASGKKTPVKKSQAMKSKAATKAAGAATAAKPRAKPGPKPRVKTDGAAKVKTPKAKSTTAKAKTAKATAVARPPAVASSIAGKFKATAKSSLKAAGTEVKGEK